MSGLYRRHGGGGASNVKLQTLTESELQQLDKTRVSFEDQLKQYQFMRFEREYTYDVANTMSYDACPVRPGASWWRSLLAFPLRHTDARDRILKSFPVPTPFGLYIGSGRKVLVRSVFQNGKVSGWQISSSANVVSQFQREGYEDLLLLCKMSQEEKTRRSKLRPRSASQANKSRNDIEQDAAALVHQHMKTERLKNLTLAVEKRERELKAAYMEAHSHNTNVIVNEENVVVDASDGLLTALRANLEKELTEKKSVVEQLIEFRNADESLKIAAMAEANRKLGRALAERSSDKDDEATALAVSELLRQIPATVSKSIVLGARSEPIPVPGTNGKETVPALENSTLSTNAHFLMEGTVFEGLKGSEEVPAWDNKYTQQYIHSALPGLGPVRPSLLRVVVNLTKRIPKGYLLKNILTTEQALSLRCSAQEAWTCSKDAAVPSKASPASFPNKSTLQVTVVRGGSLKVAGIYCEHIARLTSTLFKFGIDEICCDFVSGFDNQLYFLQVKGFKATPFEIPKTLMLLENGEVEKANHRAGDYSKALRRIYSKYSDKGGAVLFENDDADSEQKSQLKFLKFVSQSALLATASLGSSVKRCKMCLLRRPVNDKVAADRMKPLTGRMILECVFSLRKRGIDVVPLHKNFLQRQALHEQFLVCGTCYSLHRACRELHEVELRLANAVGSPVLMEDATEEDAEGSFQFTGLCDAITVGGSHQDGTLFCAPKKMQRLQNQLSPDRDKGDNNVFFNQIESFTDERTRMIKTFENSQNHNQRHSAHSQRNSPMAGNKSPKSVTYDTTEPSSSLKRPSSAPNPMSLETHILERPANTPSSNFFSANRRKVNEENGQLNSTSNAMGHDTELQQLAWRPDSGFGGELVSVVSPLRTYKAKTKLTSDSTDSSSGDATKKEKRNYTVDTTTRNELRASRTVRVLDLDENLVLGQLPVKPVLWQWRFMVHWFTMEDLCDEMVDILKLGPVYLEYTLFGERKRILLPISDKEGSVDINNLRILYLFSEKDFLFDLFKEEEINVVIVQELPPEMKQNSNHACYETLCVAPALMAASSASGAAKVSNLHTSCRVLFSGRCSLDRFTGVNYAKSATCLMLSSGVFGRAQLRVVLGLQRDLQVMSQFVHAVRRRDALLPVKPYSMACPLPEDWLAGIVAAQQKKKKELEQEEQKMIDEKNMSGSDNDSVSVEETPEQINHTLIDDNPKPYEKDQKNEKENYNSNSQNQHPRSSKHRPVSVLVRTLQRRTTFATRRQQVLWSGSGVMHPSQACVAPMPAALSRSLSAGQIKASQVAALKFKMNTESFAFLHKPPLPPAPVKNNTQHTNNNNRSRPVAFAAMASRATHSGTHLADATDVKTYAGGVKQWGGVGGPPPSMRLLSAPSVVRVTAATVEYPALLETNFNSNDNDSGLSNLVLPFTILSSKPKTPERVNYQLVSSKINDVATKTNNNAAVNGLKANALNPSYGRLYKDDQTKLVKQAYESKKFKRSHSTATFTNNLNSRTYL